MNVTPQASFQNLMYHNPNTLTASQQCLTRRPYGNQEVDGIVADARGKLGFYSTALRW